MVSWQATDDANEGSSGARTPVPTLKAVDGSVVKRQDQARLARLDLRLRDLSHFIQTYHTLYSTLQPRLF